MQIGLRISQLNRYRKEMRTDGGEERGNLVLEEPMVVNEERKKHGLAPILGGDVAVTRISDSNRELSPQD